MSYKRLGDYIQQVNVRNSDLEDLPLMGLSITKEFIPSIANTIGTDMSTYRIIERNQFAYGPVTSRNGDKITIALFDAYDKALISQAYVPFKVKDTNELNPEYLMMWFRRQEFDRYARFKSHGSAREIFDWKEMCEVELPVPPIEKQREIVSQYQAVTNKIKVNEQICEKLEATAQAIYKEWFVDGRKGEDIVLLSEYVQMNPKLSLPKGRICTYIEMANLSENTMSINGKIQREYNGGSRFQNSDTLLARITPCLENGKTAFVNILDKEEIASGSTEFIVMRAKKDVSPFWVYCLARDENFRTYAISSMVGSSGRQRVHEKYIEDFKLPEVKKERMEGFDRVVRSTFGTVKLKSDENQILTEFQAALLSKMSTI